MVYYHERLVAKESSIDSLRLSIIVFKSISGFILVVCVDSEDNRW